MQLFVNNWAAQLTAEAGPEAAQLFVAPAQAALLAGLGGDNYYIATLVESDGLGNEVAWEIVQINGANPGTGELTLALAGRGLDGTTALLWGIGSSISLRITAATLANLRDNAGADVSDAAPQPLGVASAGTSPDAARADHVHTLPTAADIGAATEAQGALADTALQESDVHAVALTGAYPDLSGKPFIPEAPGDIGAATDAQGALADTAVQPAALTAALADKVDVVPGKQLSTEDYTTAEKTKLAGLDEAHYKGTYINLAALDAAHPTAAVGDYADVDAGVGDPVLRYIWDNSDSEWVAQAGSADPITAAQAKTLYESNADTNAFTDAEKAKLGGVAANATSNPDTDSLAESGTPTNKWFTEARVRAAVATGLSFADSTVIAATDSFLQIVGKLAARLALAFDRANHTGSQAISTVTGLQAALDGKALAITTRTISGTSGTLVPADAGNIVLCTSASAVSLSIQLESTGAWPAGAVVTIIQLGAGTVTVVDGSGITVNVFSGLTKALRGQQASGSLIRTAADAFTLSGLLGGTPA